MDKAPINKLRATPSTHVDIGDIGIIDDFFASPLMTKKGKSLVTLSLGNGDVIWPSDSVLEITSTRLLHYFERHVENVFSMLTEVAYDLRDREDELPKVIFAYVSKKLGQTATENFGFQVIDDESLPAEAQAEVNAKNISGSEAMAVFITTQAFLDGYAPLNEGKLVALPNIK